MFPNQPTYFYGVILLALALTACSKPELKWEVLQSPTKAHLRGLCAVSDEVVWASGSNGVVVRTTDSGNSWEEMVIAGAEELQFRDIHAFNANEAIVVSAGLPARIYATADGGQSWLLQYEDTTPGIFLDGFAFWDRQRGMAYGDPLGSTLMVLQTTNGGKNWTRVDSTILPQALAGEAGFAASGTGIVANGKSNVWIATGGGERARVMHSADAGKSWEVFDTPLRSEEGAGIFSLAMLDAQNGVVVGGSYTDSAATNGVCAITNNGGKIWQGIEQEQPNGYRSCVAASPGGELLVAVGRTGTDCSWNRGTSWEPVSTGGYYSCTFSSTYCWASGRGGQLARVTW